MTWRSFGASSPISTPGPPTRVHAWREPVENYVNPARFDEELRLLRTMPSVFVPSATIPNPGDQVERTAFGVPLFAVRGHDRRARVFRNACRHRGFALVEGSGCARALVCRYHGWTYRLDGSLAHVPHDDAFPDLDKSARGLVEVASHEVRRAHRHRSTRCRTRRCRRRDRRG